MKYFEMLKCFAFINGIKTVQKTYTEPAPKIEPAPEPKPELPPIGETFEKLKNEEEELLALLRDMKDNLKVPENVSPDTILNEDEVRNVMDILIQLQDELFVETPISPELVKQFVWNLPRPFYEMAMRNYKKKNPPCLNPLYWFYIFCIDLSDLNPIEQECAFADAVCTAATMEDDDFEMLADNAEKYRDTLSDDDLIPD